MILEVKEFEEGIDKEKLYKDLMNDFNCEAKLQNKKYRIQIENGYPRLIKNLFFGIGDSLGKHEIYYYEGDDYFYFYGGIDSALFYDIRSILEEIKQRFQIELLK